MKKPFLLVWVLAAQTFTLDPAASAEVSHLGVSVFTAEFIIDAQVTTMYSQALKVNAKPVPVRVKTMAQAPKPAAQGSGSTLQAAKAAAASVTPTAPTRTISFDELYIQNGVLGMSFSPKTRALSGYEVNIEGFMAPPLKALGNFFVLTKNPVALCPFCNSDADWPSDIIVIYLDKATTFTQTGKQLMVSGILETGSFTDPKTGFVSQLRLKNSKWTVK